MTDDASALQLVLTGDPALFAIVQLALIVSLLAVLFAALIGVPLGALIALSHFRGREGVIVLLNALMGLPPVVVGLVVYLALSRSGPLGVVGPAVHAAGHGDRADHPGGADHRRAGAPDHRGSVGRVSRRASGDECRRARPRRHADLGRPLQPGHRVACGLRPGGGRGRRHDHRRRQYRWIHPHHDDCDRAGDFQGRPAAGCRARHGADRDRGRGQRRGLGASRAGERVAG